MIEPLTREGEVTACLLPFNQAERIVEPTILQSSDSIHVPVARARSPEIRR